MRSVVMLTHLALPFLKKSKGNIINVSSIAGSSTLSQFGMLGYSAYCASKAAIDHYTRLCAAEVAEHGVRVNAISPGPVETPMLASMQQTDATAIRELAGNDVAQPQEVADLMLYLASDKAKSITGSNLRIDCGVLVRQPPK